MLGEKHLVRGKTQAADIFMPFGFEVGGALGEKAEERMAEGDLDTLGGLVGIWTICPVKWEGIWSTHNISYIIRVSSQLHNGQFGWCAKIHMYTRARKWWYYKSIVTNRMYTRARNSSVLHKLYSIRILNTLYFAPGITAVRVELALIRLNTEVRLSALRTHPKLDRLSTTGISPSLPA
eukprot:COSAG02_NODE_794_length_17142_cov_13.622367_13_plen_179_part_00